MSERGPEQPARDVEAGAETIEGLAARLSNAGRWGADDEIGTLNFITPTVTASAAATVVAGLVVSVGHEFDLGATAAKPRPGYHRMLWRESGTTATDMIVMEPHGYEVTHVDALAHVSLHGRTYNDKDWSEVLARDGLTFGSVLPLGRGVATRGVLLDVAASRGVDFLERGEPVSPADLEAAEAWCGLQLRTGDALLVRTGLEARESISGPLPPDVRTGLDLDCLEWLHAREVAVFGGDCIEQIPSTHPGLGAPLHEIGLARMGLCLVDNIAVEELAVVCRQLGRWEFFFIAAALRIPGATGSPVNPLCIF